MNIPMVRIIIPVFNCEKYIEAGIKSVMAQTYQNWELIIINDSSTDHTLEIIEGYENKRISVITQNRGGPESA